MSFFRSTGLIGFVIGTYLLTRIGAAQVVPVELRNPDATHIITTPELVPGTSNKVSVKLKNKTGKKLILDELKVSCGCIIPGNIEKDFEVDRELEFPIVLKTDSKSGKFTKSMTIVDSEKNEWQFVIDSHVIAPIIARETQFHLDGKDEQHFILEAAVDEKYRTIVGDFRELRVEANSEFIVGLQTGEASFERGVFKIKALLPTSQMQGRAVTDSIRFSTSKFSFDLPIVFRFKNEPRVVLQSVSRRRMRDEGQRVIVVGGEPSDRAELLVKVDGIEIKTEAVKNGERISIFNISSAENMADVNEVVIGVVKKTEFFALATIKVVD